MDLQNEDLLLFKICFKNEMANQWEVLYTIYTSDKDLNLLHKEL